MKTLTLAVIAAIILTGTAAFIVHNKQATPQHSGTTATQNTAPWFNTIEIAEGITVEFVYGPQMQVFVEGDKNLVPQLALIVENQALKVVGRNQAAPPTGIRIRVVTPVLLNLAMRTGNTHTSTCKGQACIENTSTQELQIEPVLLQRNLFRVSAGRA